MNENENLQPVKKLTPFTKMVMSIGTLPSSFYASMSYYESMVWLYEYLKNTVIPTVNANAEAVEELQEAFTTLENYISTYFDNLDVQEEVNKKLDEMAEDGTITGLIQQYIDPLYQNYEERINNTITQQNAQITQFENSVNANIQSISSRVEQATSGSPLVASSTAGMTNTSRIYVNTTDGKWYYYDGDSWEIGGTYQATEIADGSITRIMLDNGLVYELNKIDNIIEFLPHKENITLYTYDEHLSNYQAVSETWTGFGIAINNPLLINKLKAPIYLGGSLGTVRCYILDSSLNELAYADATISSVDTNPYHMTTFNFKSLDTSTFGSYIYICFKSITANTTLCRLSDYTIDMTNIPEGVNQIITYGTQYGEWRTFSATTSHIFGLPYYLFDYVIEKDDISTFTVPTIYKTQFSNDLWSTPPTTLYLDSILSSKQNCYTENETDKVYLKTENETTIANNPYSLTENHYLSGEGFNDKLLAIDTITTKTSALADKSATVLQIGDSVTYGAGSQFNTDDKPQISWAYMAWLGKKYLGSYEQIGDNVSETITLANNTTYTAKAEGHGGWRLYDYLYVQTVNAGGSITANPFYDASKSWSDSDLNSAGVKFSLHKYLTDKSLPTPTHVIIQLGFNDSDSQTYSFIDNMEYIIKAIKEEYPDMIIGLSLPRDYGTWFNKFYPLLDNNASGEHGWLNTKLRNWLTSYMALEDTDNDIYYIPNYFVTPTGDSIPTYDINDKHVAFRSDGGYHPNHKAHVEWGLQQFAWLSYTLLK